MQPVENQIILSPPPALKETLDSSGLPADQILFSALSDLDFRGNKSDVWLVVTSTATAAFALRSGVWEIATGPFALKDIERVRTFQSVGSGFLQLLIADVYVDIVRYSNKSRETFDRVQQEFDRLLKGESFRPDALTRPTDRVCDECGIPLPTPGASCPSCRASRGLFLRTLGLMKPYYGYVALLLGISAVAVCLEQIPPQITRYLFDRVLVPRENAEMLVRILVALVCTHAIQQALAIFSGRMSSWIGTRVTREMRERLQEKLVGISVDYHDRHSAGGLMSRVLYDVEFFHSFVQQVAQGLIVNVFRVVAIGAILFLMDWRLATFVMLPIPFVILGTTLFWRHIYPRHYRFADSRSKLSQMLSGFYSGIRLVKAFGQERREMGRFDRSAQYMQNSERDLQMSIATFNPIIAFLFTLGGLAVWYTGGRGVLNNEISMGTLVAFISYVGMFYTPVSALTNFSQWVSGFMTAGQRVFEVLDATTAVPTDPEPERPPVIAGAVELRGVTFGYDPYSPVVKNVSLRIEAGQSVGIVGKSGSGKTTLINLICRFCDPQRGQVLVDGINVKKIAPELLHHSVGLVLQEPFLFRDTISANIAYGRPDALPGEIQDAARAANAHGFISELPMGYDTRLGERGAGLSGGERQRVSIARALLCNPRVLILDEATSSVDTESEQEIQRALLHLSQGRTTIAIAHRLATLRNADVIYVLDDGQIAEFGSHDQLMALDGIYARLVVIQTQLTKLEA